MHRCTAWIACFAILLAALAPSISHALAIAGDGSGNWVEICTVSGSKLVSANHDHQSPAPADKFGHLKHCPFCLSHAVSVGLLPPADFTLPVVAGTHILPSLFYQAPRPLFAWAVAQPRAPPAFS